MTSRNVLYSMPRLMGLSLAAPLIVQGDAQSHMPNMLDLRAGTSMESVDAAEWVAFSSEEVPEKETFSYTINPPDKEWRGRDERQFMCLVKKEALGTISHEESQALDVMSRERDLLKNQLSIKEIMFRRKQMETELRLLEAAREYFLIRSPHARSSH